jgi:hypothetical protein
VVLDEEHADFLPEFQPNEFVQLSIADTGTGMRPEVRDRAFEPLCHQQAERARYGTWAGDGLWAAT